MDRRGGRGRTRSGTRICGTHSPPLHSPVRVDDDTHIPMGEVMNMMHSFQQIYDALINRLDREDIGASILVEGSQHPPKENAQRELEKVKFPKFWGAPDGELVEEWIENMAMLFAFRDYTSNLNLCMGILQLKGGTLLWWKTLLPQLGMDILEITWDMFQGCFREHYLYEVFTERKLNEFNALKQGSRIVPK